MGIDTSSRGRGETGSAMVIALLVTVILTLLGISYLLMAETENRISENERLSDQALFTGEAGARMVKRWFDRPGKASNLINPPLAVIDRSLRQIDADGDPATTPVAADGSGSKPYYKQNIDLNGDSTDDVFHKPYRDDLFNTLLGTEAGPDMRIDEDFSTAAKTFLENLSTRLLSGYPASNGSLQARITRIDVYAPPYVNVAGVWTRYGMGTVKVWARIYKDTPSGEEVLAERMIKAVLNETPFPGPFGPLHSCDDLSWNGDFTVKWGVSTAVSNSDLANNHGKLWASLPRVVPPGERIDLLWGFDDDAGFAAYKTAIEGEAVQDPWFRYLSGGPLADAPNGNPDPWAFVWDAISPLADQQWPNHDNNPQDGTHSNVLQNQPMVTCPNFDYEVWKGIATSGGSDVHYYVWSSDQSFKENGFGTAQTFRAITDNAEGLYFFDTTDGIAPYDDGGDGEFDNLTPKITIQGGTWGVRGFVYLNSTDFQTKGVTGRAATFKMPGEPFQDKNQNGSWDVGEDWINLAYPTANIDDAILAAAADDMADDGTTGSGIAVRNSNGPEVNGTASLWGILYTNGYWDAQGNATYYGSVISKSGIGEASPTAGTPNLYWDEDIIKNWPPEDWDLPRVVITRWETDL